MAQSSLVPNGFRRDKWRSDAPASGLISVDQKCGPQHPQTLAIKRWATAEACHLLLENFGLFGVKPGAAIFDRPLWRSEASIRQASNHC